MDENQALASLRTVLAFLYESEYDARRVAEDAGLNVQQIPFSGKAINLWNAILREAEKEGKTAILMGVTFREFKENQKLSTAWYDYLKAAGESAVETNQPMPAAMSEQPLSPQRPSPQRSSGQRHWGRIITIAVVLIIAVVAIWRVVELIGNSTLPAAFPPSTRQSVATATPHKAQVGAVRIATVTPRPKATATPTASARSYFDRGRKLMDEGKYQSAIAQFDLALEHGLKSAELYYNRGLACYGLQDLEQQCGYTKAIAEYDKAIALEPNNADYYAARAWSYRHLEDPQSIEQAIADWQRAAELDPTNSTYPREIGWRLKEMGNIEGALAQLNRAIELDGDYWAYIGRGQIYNEHFHDPEQALSDFSRAIEQEPDDANPYAHRAWFFMAQRQWEKALVDLDQAIALAPDWFGLYWDRGNVHKALENVEATRTDYQAFLNLLAEKNEPDWASQRDEARDWLQLTANLTEKNTLKVRISITSSSDWVTVMLANDIPIIFQRIIEQQGSLDIFDQQGPSLHMNQSLKRAQQGQSFTVTQQLTLYRAPDQTSLPLTVEMGCIGETKVDVYLVDKITPELLKQIRTTNCDLPGETHIVDLQ